jgi:zinc transport system permease protein
VNPLSFQFMQLALVSALLVGVAAPAVGVFLVQRRLALMGDGLGHVALTGVALGFLLGTAPVLTAVGVATLGAVVIELVRQQGRTSGDVALALMFYGGIAGGVLLIGLSPRGRTQPAVVPVRLAHGGVAAGRRRHRRPGRRPAARRSRCSAPAVRRSATTRSTPGSMGLPVRALNLLLAVHAALTVTVRDAGRRPAARQRAHGRAGRDGASSWCAVPATSSSRSQSACSRPSPASSARTTPTPAPGALIVVLALAAFGVAAVVGAVLRRTRRAPAPAEPVGVRLPEGSSAA